MKKKNRLSAGAAWIALIALIASSCAWDRIERPESNETNKDEVRFSSNIITQSLGLRMSGNEWEENDEIGVYMLDENTTDVVEEKANVTFVAQADGAMGTFKAKDLKIYYPDNGAKVRFMSYYPYQSSVANGVYLVDVSNQASQSDIDLLYSFEKDAFYSKGTTSKTVSLSFNHCLTKLKVNVKSGEGLTEEDLEDLQVTFSGLHTQVEFNLLTGLLGEPIGAVSDITPKSVAAPANFVAGYESILLPMTDIPAGAKMVFSLKNGDQFSWNFAYELEASNMYVYNVTINRSEVQVEATINEWTDGGNSNIDAE